MNSRPYEIRVECYAGHRGEQTPLRFYLGDNEIEVAELLDSWLAPDHRYFKVRGDDDAVYILLAREVASLSYDQPWLFGPPIRSLYPLGYPTWLVLLRLTLANVDTVDDGVEKVRIRVGSARCPPC